MYSWTYVERLVFSKPVHEDVIVPVNEIPNPHQNGYFISIGDFQGQEYDLEKAFEDGRRIHVRKFEDCYKVHWDFFSPVLDPINHLRHDSPEWYVILSTAAGAGLGSEISENSEEGAFIGGVLGFIASILTLPSEGNKGD